MLLQGLDPDDLASYRLLHDLSVLSPLELTEAAVVEFKKAGGGSVVSTCSGRPHAWVTI